MLPLSQEGQRPNCPIYRQFQLPPCSPQFDELRSALLPTAYPLLTEKQASERGQAVPLGSYIFLLLIIQLSLRYSLANELIKVMKALPRWTVGNNVKC